MATVLEQVEKAISRGDRKQARALLDVELTSNPTAEAYYLASLLAFNQNQQREFLEQALAIYPFHKKAYLEMQRINARHSLAVETHAEFPFATLMARFTAYLIDTFIIALPYLTLITLLSNLGLMPLETVPYINIFGVSFLNAPNPTFLLVCLVISIILNSLYNVYFLTKQNGQTLGKALCNIRIVSLTGDKITVYQAFMRNIVGYWVSAIFLNLGYLWAIWDPNHQAWHDKFAKTLVIKAT